MTILCNHLEISQVQLVNEMVDILVHVLCNRTETIKIGKNEVPASTVKKRLLSLTTNHIQYVLDCFITKTTKVHNVRAYLLTSLLQAPTTIESYYTAMVQHDLQN